jgi:signal transduction histidine kinase/ActR/RegA family two-component response regulator
MKKPAFLEEFALPDMDLTTRIQARGLASLLEMTYGRLIFGMTIMPFVAVLFSVFYAQFENALPLWGWCATYAVFSVFMHIVRRRYLRDKATLPDAALFAKWRPAVERMALVHGLLISAPVFLTLGRAPVEFVLLLIVTYISIVSSNATHQTPVFSVFLRFLAATAVPIPFFYWALPPQWHALIPLSFVYVLGMYRHAKKSHLFYVQQVLLEEQSARLAAQYKEAKELSENALLEKTRFLATASHDLRQPVHAMGMMIEAIHQRNKDQALTPLLEDLRSGVKSVNYMFNSLLDLSKIESGAVAPKKETVAAERMMYDITTLFGEEARRRGLTLRLHESKQNVIVLADPVLLRQALVNLTHNALRYTLKGGVLLGSRKRGTYWQLEVWDTGVGIANEQFDTVHSPFYARSQAWDINDVGHGLGLSVVARCAQLMSAGYGVTSKLGIGTRFWLRLPAVDPGVAAIGHVDYVAHLEATNLRTLSGTCLVVEDDPQVSQAWAALLQAWGVQAHIAPDGVTAFQIIDAGFSPDAIFCDQRLRSGESGFDVLRALLARSPDAHGAMVSGELHSPELAHAEQEGYIILKKPLNVEELHAVLSRWLSASTLAHT